MTRVMHRTAWKRYESEYQQLAASRVSERNVWESVECSITVDGKYFLEFEEMC